MDAFRSICWKASALVTTSPSFVPKPAFTRVVPGPWMEFCSNRPSTYLAHGRAQGKALLRGQARQHTQSRRALAEDWEILLTPLGLEVKKQQRRIGQILPKLTPAGFSSGRNLGRKRTRWAAPCPPVPMRQPSASKSHHRGRDAAAENHLQPSWGILACSTTSLELRLLI